MSTDNAQITLGGLTVDVVKKPIKNVHLSVYPPEGRVRVSAPEHMTLETLRVFIISKLGWIKKQQQKLRAQEREAPREMIERESHYYNGQRYLLKVIEHDGAARVELRNKKLQIYVRPQTPMQKRRELLDSWYRQELKRRLPEIIATYEMRMGVKVEDFGVKLMRTRWGTCNPQAKRIWLNLELAKKPPECLEYVVVHEMAHLLEPSHNDRFIELMDRYMPKWRLHKDELNRLPVRHENWEY